MDDIEYLIHFKHELPQLNHLDQVVTNSNQLVILNTHDRNLNTTSV